MERSRSDRAAEALDLLGALSETARQDVLSPSEWMFPQARLGLRCVAAIPLIVGAALITGFLVGLSGAIAAGAVLGVARVIVRVVLGRGYATEGSRALIEKAFEVLGVRRV